MKKIILNFVLIVTISVVAKSQIVIDSTAVINTCLDCDSIGVVPLPNAYGSLYIEVSGGVSPYTFSLTGLHNANTSPLVTSSASGITNFYNSLCQDTFALVISDDIGASTIYNFTTVPPLPPTLSIDSVTVLADSTNNPNSGVIDLHVTTNADSVFYLIQDIGNTLNLGTIGGWQDSTLFDSLPGGYYYKVFVDIYPKISPSCGNGIDSGTSVFQIYVPLACENDGFADFGFFPACVGDAVAFPDFSNPGSGQGNNIISWDWDFGDGNFSSGPLGVNTYTQAGVYLVSLQVTTSHGCVFINAYPVNIEPLPTTSFNYTNNGSGQCLFTDQSTINTGVIASWLWDFGDGNTSSMQNPTHQYTSSGQYSVCLTTTSNFGCVDSTCQSIDFVVGINSVNNLNKIKIFPNPADDYITINNKDYAVNKIEIIDFIGKTIQIIYPESNTINIENLERGIYFIKIVGNDLSISQKFIKR